MPTEQTFRLHPDAATARAAAAWLFVHTASMLRGVLPHSADIRHIGATAIPGCLTKGDLDIVVRVAPNDFAQADKALADRFSRNTGSVQTETFSAFEDVEASPHLGIQLTVVGGPYDDFHLFAETLQGDAQLVSEYNLLKRRCDRWPMEDYRAAKDRFIADVLAGRAVSN